MTEQQERVGRLIARIEQHQKDLGHSDTRFVARYQKHLGSTKTWRDRLCARAWGEIGHSLEKWEKKLTAFVTEIDGNTELDGFMTQMPIARYGEAVYDALQGQRNDRRVAWLIGPTGVGKSWTMTWLARQNVTEAVYLHVNRSWKDSMTVNATSLANAVGAQTGLGGAATFRNVVETLKANPITLLIDDVHEGGLLLIRLVKHLVDDTKSKFILGTYPTGWRMLLRGYTDAHSEAQQLIGRSLKPINNTWIDGLTKADTAGYLHGALGGNGEWKVVAERVSPLLARHGMRALADAVELAQMNAADQGCECTPALVEAAIRELCPLEKR